MRLGWIIDLVKVENLWNYLIFWTNSEHIADKVEDFVKIRHNIIENIRRNMGLKSIKFVDNN